MAGLGRKVFTAGDVLTASDVQNYLMDQTVMNFAGTAARSSAIATPTTGMTTYIGVTGTATIPQIETYTGSAWQTPYGLTLVANVSFSAASIQVEGIFSAVYDNYRVELAIDAPAASAWTGVQMVSGSTPTTTSTYSYMRRFDYNTAAGGYEASATSDRMNAMFTNAAGFGFVGFDLANPFLTKNTFLAGTGASRVTAGGAGYGYLVQGITPDTTSYNGIKFLFPASCAGTLKIYGYRNS